MARNAYGRAAIFPKLFRSFGNPMYLVFGKPDGGSRMFIDE